MDGESLFESGDEIGDEDDEELIRVDIAQLWLRKQTRPEYPHPPEAKSGNTGKDFEIILRTFGQLHRSAVFNSKNSLELVPDEPIVVQSTNPEHHTEPKPDVPLESHVSTAILVADDDEDDERNQTGEEGATVSDLKKQNKTEEVPLKTNNIFSSLVDRSKYFT